MSRDRSRSPRLEPLEGRQLLSTARASRAVPAPKLAAQVLAPAQSLDGDLSGSLRDLIVRGGATSAMSQPFAGTIPAIGPVIARVNTLYNGTTRALIRGEIIVAGQAGSLRLAFADRDQVSHRADDSSAEAVGTYRVDSGSGAFATTKGSGTFKLSTSVADNRLHLVLRSNRT